MVFYMKFTSVREITAYKRKLNWGELPPFFHMVSNSLAELEGVYKHGFINDIKRILDKRNWNLSLLEGRKRPDGEIEVKHKPRVVLYRRNTDRGYEIHCYPLIGDQEVRQYAKDIAELPFKIWEPQGMGNLIRVNNLVEFIRHTYLPGDDADRELVKFAHLLTEEIIGHISEHLDVVEDRGYSIKEMLDHLDKHISKKNNPELNASQGSLNRSEQKQ
jgi:hypothetical protein